MCSKLRHFVRRGQRGRGSQNQFAQRRGLYYVEKRAPAIRIHCLRTETTCAMNAWADTGRNSSACVAHCSFANSTRECTERLCKLE